MNGYIPQEIIDDILARTDLLELVGSYLPLRKMGKNYFGLCPFHSEDSPSFCVHPDKQYYRCYGCGKGGNALQFVMELEALPFPEAVEKLASRCGVTLPERRANREDDAKAAERKMLLRMHSDAAEFYAAQLNANLNGAAGAYLKRRGIDPQLALRFNLGLAPEDDWQALAEHLRRKGYTPAQMETAGLVSRSAKNGKYYDKFHGRLIFPINDYRGQCIAFGGRVIGEGEPKYLNSSQTPIYNKSVNLFALQLAGPSIREKDAAVLMEGYMDVLTAHQYGVSNAIASLGTALTPEQVRLLKRYTTNAYISYDGDGAGLKAARRAIDILREQGFSVRVLVYPQGMDPDDFLRKYGADGWAKLLQRSLSPLEFMLKLAESKYDITDVVGKGQVVAELLPGIAKTGSSVERESFIRLLADRLGVAAETIYADLRKSGLNIAPPPKPKTAPAPEILHKQEIMPGVGELLLRLALEDKNVCQRLAAEALQGDLLDEKGLQLLNIVNKNDYDQVPAHLLSRFNEDNAGLRDFLLKLLDVELPNDDRERLAAEYFQAAQANRLQRRIDVINKEVAAGAANWRELLTELNELQRKLQQLKG